MPRRWRSKNRLNEIRHQIFHRSGHRAKFKNRPGARAGGVAGAPDCVREPHPKNRIALPVAGKD